METNFRTPNPGLRTSDVSLDEVLLQIQTGCPRKVLFWGERTGGISSYAAGWIASRGIGVVVLDGANRFDPYTVSSFARRASISSEKLLKSVRIARAFTCYQMATLIEEKLVSLIEREGKVSPWEKPWVILLGPITTFLDEDVPEREAGPLFERSLRKMEKMAEEGVPFFVFQSFFPSDRNPPFPSFARGGDRGLMSSRRTYLMKRLFQFSSLAWEIDLEDGGAKLILRKSPSSIRRAEALLPGTGKH